MSPPRWRPSVRRPVLCVELLENRALPSLGLVSVNAAGIASASGGAALGSASADGRYVAFESNANDILPFDYNGTGNVYVRDLLTGTTTLVSVNVDGDRGGDSDSTNPSLSADGHYVAFQSDANDLVPGGTTFFRSHIYVRDRVAGTTTQVDVAQDGSEGNSYSQYPTISADGRYVAFTSNASNLTPDDGNGFVDVFVRDLMARTTTLASVGNNANTLGMYAGANYALSASGRVVAYMSAGDQGLSEDRNNDLDIFARDLDTGTTSLVSVNQFGLSASGPSYSLDLHLSADGRFVTFTTNARDLVPSSESNTNGDFVRDLRAGVTYATTRHLNGVGADLSSDGRYVVFYTNDDLVPEDTNQNTDVYVLDLTNRITSLISQKGDGTASGASYSPTISAGGRYVAFSSAASDLVPGDTNDHADYFIRDLVAATTTRVALPTENVSGNNYSVPMLTADGRLLFFESDQNGVASNDNNSFSDLFYTPVGTSYFQFSIAEYTVSETAGNASVTVTRVGDLSDTATVRYTATDGTAVNGRDYRAVTGTLAFAPGQDNATITVPILRDAVREENETVRLILGNPTGAVLAGPSSARLLIVDPNPPSPPASLVSFALALTHSSEAYTAFLTAAYHRYLGRTPDAGGLAFWVGAMQQGLTDEQVESNFLGSPEYIANHGGAGDVWFGGIYHDVLGRLPDDGGRTYWGDRLANGASPVEVALGFVHSDERHLSRTSRDYVRFLGRIPSPDEPFGWLLQYQAGARVEDVTAGLVGSTEYFNQHGANRPDWIAAAFHDILHRPPTMDDLANWLAVLR